MSVGRQGSRQRASFHARWMAQPGHVGAVYPNWDAYQSILSLTMDTPRRCCADKPPVYSAQTSCIHILPIPPYCTTLDSHYDHHQPSNIVLLTVFILRSFLDLSDMTWAGAINRHTPLTSSSVFFLKTLA